jgi:hypothetical protein
MNIKLSKRVLTALLCCLLVQFAAQADSYSSTGQSNEQAPATTSAPQLSSQQIQQLVAPIVLYPDALVAQVLAASTYPAEQGLVRKRSLVVSRPARYTFRRVQWL